MLLVLNLELEAQISDVSIIGFFTEGSTIAGYYTLSPSDTLTNPTFQFDWFVYDDATSLSSDSTFALTSSEVGERMLFMVVSINIYGDKDTVYSPVSPVVTSNSKPVASNISVSGGKKVGNVLTGLYDYYDADNDVENGSLYEWARSPTSSIFDAVTIAGADERAYQLSVNDIGKYLFFGVTPVAQTGYTTGDQLISSAHGPVIPLVTDVSIIGDIIEYDTVAVYYTISPLDPLTNPTYLYNWFAYGNPTSLSSDSTFILTSGEVGERLLFRIIRESVADAYKDTTYSPLSPVVIANSMPSASAVSVSGDKNVGDVVIGSYDYNDVDGDIEDGSVFEWTISATTDIGDGTVIGTATDNAYKILNTDQGQYLFFSVTPIAKTGNTDGIRVSSSAFGPVNSAPVASLVTIDDTSPEIGNMITGSYVYDDVDGDSEGSSYFRWLRDGTEEITGANSKTYTVTNDDAGRTLTFEVTPVAGDGYPDTGIAAQSPATDAVPFSGLPQAVDVCISGINSVGQKLTGYYEYVYPIREEGASSYQWYKNGEFIEDATLKQYTLLAGDIGATIEFGVVPRSKAPKIQTGLEAKSAPLAIISLLTDNLSVADPPLTLTAVPAGGVFSGEGVSIDQFDPSSVNPDDSPFTITYLLSLSYDSHTCVQQTTDEINVRSVTTYFDSFKNVYCYDNGFDTIIVKNIPSDAINLQMTLTNPAALISSPNESTFVIDPAIFGPGDKQDSIYFSYESGVSFITIYRPFIIDSVSTVLTFQNLEVSYCTDASARYITVEGVYPAGGSGIWTSSLISSSSVTSAVLNPGLVEPDAAYPLAYQYRSPMGCYSAIISENVDVHDLPDPSFAIDPTYNVDGGPATIIPVQSGGTFTGAGIVEDDFYPDLAGVGSHEIRYSITDANNCFATTTNNTIVREAQGTIESLPAVICYNDTTYNIEINDLPSGVTIVGYSNSKEGLKTTGATTAEYYIPEVGADYDTVKFSYIWDGVDYELTKIVYVDSIGKVEIIGLRDSYCEYEGDINLRVSVENSSGTGNFTFSGPDTSFVNYGVIADIYPYKTPPSETPYVLTYTHVSSVHNSGCRKMVIKDVYVYPQPVIQIITDRETANFEEEPFALEGEPVDGLFTGDGVYKDGSIYRFNPQIAGLGYTDITFSYVDNNSCYSSLTTSILIAEAKGIIEGVDPNNQYCYDGGIDTLTYTNSNPGWNPISFQGPGITNIEVNKAIFDPEEAGKGDHTIMYSYYDSVLTRFDVLAKLKVDSVGMVEIINLDPFTEFCNNIEPIELFTSKLGGVFTGPVDDNFLDPSLGLADVDVTYTYTNSTSGCSTSVTVPIRINPAPSVSYTVEDVCIDFQGDTTRFVNTTFSADPVATWAWKFGDPGIYNESNLKDPGHVYSTYGPRLVMLTSTTINNCVSMVEKNIDLGFKPVADFSWQGDCFHPDDSLLLFDKSISTTPITGYNWNFFDGNTPLTTSEVKYPKNAVGSFNVEFIVFTNYADCHDTITKEVYIRPSVLIGNDLYFEDFESGDNGWRAGMGEQTNQWAFGTPDRVTIDGASSGINAWYTAFDIANQQEADYSVESPCFDFTGIERPMISLDIWKRFDRNRDGASLQYKIGDNGTWKLLGSYEDGINWYNSVAINGTPGNLSIGWTSVGGQDTGWVNARNRLDILSNRKDVKLRIIYGSDGTSNENEGIAFDNVRIGSRDRVVLLEHFTNYNDQDNREANELLKEVVEGTLKDLVTLQYHTNVPASDQFYYDSEADISARMLFYGLADAPYSFVDGGINDQYAFEYEWFLSNKVDSLDIFKRGMIEALFDIDINSEVSGGVLSVNGTIKSLTDINVENLTLYIAVDEKEVSIVTGPNGETTFYNVFKKMLPDAGGVDLKKSWTKGEEIDFTGYSWIIENIYDAGDIEIIVFLQNNLTKEVYQAKSTVEINIPTGLRNLLMDEPNIQFAIYPNPAYHDVVVSFREALDEDLTLKVYNGTGLLVRTENIFKGDSQLALNDLNLPEGIYIIRLEKSGVTAGYKKLIITKR